MCRLVSALRPGHPVPPVPYWGHAPRELSESPIRLPLEFLAVASPLMNHLPKRESRATRPHNTDSSVDVNGGISRCWQSFCARRSDDTDARYSQGAQGTDR